MNIKKLSTAIRKCLCLGIGSAMLLCLIIQTPMDFASYRDWAFVVSLLWLLLFCSVVLFYAEKLDSI